MRVLFYFKIIAKKNKLTQIPKPISSYLVNPSSVSFFTYGV